MTYRDRRDAGEKLAGLLQNAVHARPVTVFAIPRGGVVVGAAIAKRLAVPLDIVIVKKIGAPANPEFALGAVDADGIATLGDHAQDIPTAYLKTETARMKREIARRLKEYRASGTYELRDQTAILVDDGIATGNTVLAAINFLKRHHAHSIILAVPVAPPETLARFAAHVDQVLCPLTPKNLMAVGAYYEKFDQVSDEEVRRLLAESNRSAR